MPGLADRAGVELKECLAALEVLKKPDEWSRSQEYGGRRIGEVDGGWLILNGEKYKIKLSQEDRREYQRQKQAEYRRKKKKKNGPLVGEATYVKVAKEAGFDVADKLLP